MFSRAVTLAAIRLFSPLLGGCEPSQPQTAQEGLDAWEREKKEWVSRDNAGELLKWQNDNNYQPKYKNEYGHPTTMPYFADQF